MLAFGCLIIQHAAGKRQGFAALHRGRPPGCGRPCSLQPPACILETPPPPAPCRPAARPRAAERGRPGQRGQRHQDPAGRAGGRALPADPAGRRRGAQPAGALDLQAIPAQVPGGSSADDVRAPVRACTRAASGGGAAGHLPCPRAACDGGGCGNCWHALATLCRTASSPRVVDSNPSPALSPRCACSKEILAHDGVGVIVRSCRWRPDDASFRPKQEVRTAASSASWLAAWMDMLRTLLLACSRCCWDNGLCAQLGRAGSVLWPGEQLSSLPQPSLPLPAPLPPQAQLVRANPAFVRGIAGNAFSCLCIASQNLGG